MDSHDRLFKELFRAFFDDLLRLTLPWLERRLGDDAPRFLPGELHLPRPRDGDGRDHPRRADLVAEVRGRSGDPELVLVHVEIERRRRRNMARRLREYSQLLSLAYGHEVVPLVVYLTGGCQAGVRRETLVGRLWGEELYRFHYFAFALAPCEAADYLARPEPLAAALASLMRSGDLDRPRHKLECLRRIVEAGHLDGAARSLLAACVDTYLELEGTEAVEFERLIQEELPMALPEKTIYERWEERGLEQGLEQGLHQGRLEEARRWLLRLLELRFGPPDETIRRRVAALDDLDELERLGDRLPTAASPEDLGLA